MLSERQKFGLMLGLLAICVIGLLPPWRLHGAQDIPLGYAPIFQPPVAALTNGSAGTIDLDFSRLGLEAIIACVLTIGLVIVSGGNSKSGGAPGVNQGGFMARLMEAQAQAQQVMLANQEAQKLAQNATAPAAAAAKSAASAPAAASHAAASTTAKPLNSNFTRVELPQNYYLGDLLVESDDDPEYWDLLCPAKGTVDVPKGKKLQLEVAKDIRVDLSVLSSFPSGLLYSIDASECKLTDEDVSKLVVVNGLRELDLAGTPITSESVSKLRALGRLERLWLDRTLINDDCIPALGSLSKLKKLSLTETKLNALSLESLRKDLSNCEVVS